VFSAVPLKFVLLKTNLRQWNIKFILAITKMLKMVVISK
jgi:hypothetical protein